MNVYSVRLYYEERPDAEKEVFVVASSMDSGISLAQEAQGTTGRLHWKPKTVHMLMPITAIEPRT